MASLGGVGGKPNKCGLECELALLEWCTFIPLLFEWWEDGSLGKGEHQEGPVWCAGWGTIGGFASVEIHGWRGEWKWGLHTWPLVTRPVKTKVKVTITKVIIVIK